MTQVCNSPNSISIDDNSKDNISEVVAAIVMAVVGISAFLGMPIIVGALTDGYGLSETQAGYHAAISTAGSILASVLVSFLIASVNRQMLLLVGLVVAAIFSTATAFTLNFNTLLLLGFAAGFGGGIVYAVGIALLAGTRHVGKNFSILLFSQGIFGSLALYSLPKIAVNFGAPSIFLTLSLVFTLVIPIAFLVAKKYQAEQTLERCHKENTANALSPWLSLISIFFFYFAVGSFWTYVERLGKGADLSMEFVTNSLTIGNILALVGCLIAYWLSERVGQARPLIVALACLCLAFGLLSSNINLPIYLFGVFSFFLFWNFIDIFQLGTLSELDHSGSFAALAPAFQTLGIASGPALSAWLLSQNWQLSNLMMLNSASTLIAFFTFLLVYFLSFKKKKNLRIPKQFNKESI